MSQHHLHHFRMTLVLIAALLAATGCASLGPDRTPMVAEVISMPAGLTILKGNEVVGMAPLKLSLIGLDEAASLTVDEADDQFVVRRIQVFSPSQVRVVLTVSDQPSAIAQALGLTDIVVFDYGERALFRINSHELDPDLMRTLTSQARVLAERFAGTDLHICGHTDSSGTDDFNSLLSVRRAQAVAEVLEQYGVSPERMNVQGLGSDYPLAPNSTPGGRALNRRTEIVIGQ